MNEFLRKQIGSFYQRAWQLVNDNLNQILKVQCRHVNSNKVSVNPDSTWDVVLVCVWIDNRKWRTKLVLKQSVTARVETFITIEKLDASFCCMSQNLGFVFLKFPSRERVCHGYDWDNIDKILNLFDDF